MTRFFLVLGVFTIGLIIVFFAMAYMFSAIKWYSGGLLYVFFRTFNNNIIEFLVLSWGCGFLIIFLIYWRKTLRYIDIIVEATNQIVETDDQQIQLPVELKHVEDQMNLVKREALRNARLVQEAEQRKHDLIVYLAHDLKTPLTSVIGYLTLLHDEQEISARLRDKYLSIALEKAERLEDLINEFFEITRFNLNQISIQPKRVNISRMLEQITFEFQPMLAEKNLKCELSMESNLEVVCDPNKMERVFDNLLHNAINYSYEDGVITINIIHQEDGVRIVFENQGDTISSEQQERIFEQFFRLDASRATKTGGAGLGLAIAKEIVERHNGTISIFSEHEKIRFTIFLPAVS
ncbi:HAMP domain-containing sensor histidine kinase [Paenibacillus sp. UNCCL117]|uniref:sensor histidine kinase n=1 Tax=unclassified Paenibacillus TaxID=185978 RepID=UPI000931A36D